VLAHPTNWRKNGPTQVLGWGITTFTDGLGIKICTISIWAHTNSCTCYQNLAHIVLSDTHDKFARGFCRLLRQHILHGLVGVETKEVPKSKCLIAWLKINCQSPINKHKLPRNNFRLPRNRLACNIQTSPPNSQHTRLPSTPYTVVSSSELPGSTTATAWPPKAKQTHFISLRGLSGPMTMTAPLALSLFCCQTALLSPQVTNPWSLKTLTYMMLSAYASCPLKSHRLKCKHI